MTERTIAPVTVGAVRIGRTDLGEASVVLEDDALIVVVRSTSEEQPVRMGLGSIDFVTAASGETIIGLRDGTRVTFVTTEPSELAVHVLDRCRALPELTRTLRNLGSRRGSRARRQTSAADQRRFFAPLLDARRAATGTVAPGDAIAAFAAAALLESFTGALRDFAVQRHPEEGPHRRALEAELEELTEPLLASIRLLGETAAHASESIDDLRRWRAWAGQLRATFETADRVWVSLDVALDAVPRAP